jgi:hypothetical protein
MGWPSYLEDILRRREDSGLAPPDHTWRRRPARVRDELAGVRQDFEFRQAAHAMRYRERQRRSAFRRFVGKLLKWLRLIK